jgi:predicted transcriptional regulator
MTNIDDIPSHFINKAGIANRLSISRVTVDRALTKIAKDPILHSRLKVHIVSEGKRTLYFYDPSDVDAVFGELQRSNKGRSKTVRNINRKVTTTSTSQSTALLEKDVQHLQSLLAKSESEVADLKDQRDKKDRQIEFLQAQLTDQRPNSASTAPEVTEEVVVPPKPATVAEIKEAVADADKSDVGPKQIERDDRISIVDCRVKVSTAMSFENDLSGTQSEKVWMVFHRSETEPNEETITGATYLDEGAGASFVEGTILDHMLHVDVKEDVVLTDALKSHSIAYQLWNSALSKYYDAVGPTDAEIDEHIKLQKEEDTQPTSEAPTDTEKEARRDNIAPKAEPQQVQKKGFWNWLKGY